MIYIYNQFIKSVVSVQYVEFGHQPLMIDHL